MFKNYVKYNNKGSDSIKKCIVDLTGSRGFIKYKHSGSFNRLIYPLIKF